MPSSKKKRGREAKQQRRPKEQLARLPCHGATKNVVLLEDFEHRLKILTSVVDAANDLGLLEGHLDSFAQAQPDIIINGTFSDYLIAFAADETILASCSNGKEASLLHNNVAKMMTGIAIHFIYRITPHLRGEDVGIGSTHYEKLNEKLEKIETWRGMVRFLSKRTPCNCLGGLNTAAKASEKTAFCYGCKEEVPRSVLRIVRGSVN